jgi:ATP-binding cassette subfamily F protein 3
LDLEAVMWLESYLESHYAKTLIVVSHDRNFLNMVTTDTIYMAQQALTYHKGNYASFEKTREEHLRQQRKAYDAQQMKIAHMQEFIDRFRCNAKKAPLVQSRIKALEKIMRTAIEEPEDPRGFKMVFPPPEPLGRPIISIENVAFQYTPSSPLLFEDVNFGVDMSSRIGILGVNGSGKSTLINLLLGKLEPTQGKCVRNPRVRISTFTQHHVDSLDLAKSAVENMKVVFCSKSTVYIYIYIDH